MLRRLERPGGHLLAFLAGAGEIERTARTLRPRLPDGTVVFPLHGSLDAAAQDAALQPTSRRKIVLATNIAETSLTVDGVTDVVDAGRHKVLRLDPNLGLDRLELERIPQDAADQRAGRAGRTGPGHVVRLWDRRDVLQPRRQPELRRIDLARPFLEVLAWGEDPRAFGWFESPDPQRSEVAWELLGRLGALDDQGRLTRLGRSMNRLPLHPRLARLLLALRSHPELGADACAALAEGWSPGEPAAGDCDVQALVDRIELAPRRVREASRQLRRRLAQLDESEALDPPAARPDAAGNASDATPALNEITPTDESAVPAPIALRKAVYAAYADRLARRREPDSPRLLLASGHGAELGPESGLHGGTFLVAVDLRAAAHGTSRASRVRMASKVEREWLRADHREVEHRLDPQTGRVRAYEIASIGRLPLEQRSVAVDPAIAAERLCAAMLERAPDPTSEQWFRRLRFAGLEIDRQALLLPQCRGRDGWFEPDWDGALDWNARKRLETHAPDRLDVPSGRSVSLEYRDDETVVAAVKLQELFGLAETPRIGPRRVAVLFELLAPNGRPVQTTRDLRSFWNETYADVRKELRGRYPKHPWPENPWEATPTHRTRRRR